MLAITSDNCIDNTGMLWSFKEKEAYGDQATAIGI